MLLIKDELLKNNINIEKDIDQNIKLNGIENEFKHVILNLISNSKDAYIENNLEERIIGFNLFKQNKNIILEVYDKAGGIPQSIIDTVFNANVTTKKEGKGTGIGLYMTTQIIDKLNGKISVQNKNNGAVFTITIQI